MILTPEQIERWTEVIEISGFEDHAETLRAYAEIVQKVAETPYDCADDEENSYCFYCGGPQIGWGDTDRTDSEQYDYGHRHEPGCLYLAARKLRGLE